VAFRQVEQFREFRNACAIARLLLRKAARIVASRPQAPDVVALQLRVGQAVNRRGCAHPLPIRPACDVGIEPAVVVNDDDAVARDADVQLQGRDAQLQRAREGRQRVLRQVPARAAVALHVDHRIICVCVVTERSLPASSVMRVSQTWVRRPLWIGVATAWITPARQPAMKLVFDSSVAVRCPSARFATVPAAPIVSAKAISVPPWTTPVVVSSLSVTVSRATTRSGATSTNSMPRCATSPTFK